MTTGHLLLNRGLHDPRRRAERQPLPPAGPLAEVLAGDFHIGDRLRHDGTVRTASSRTPGWHVRTDDGWMLCEDFAPVAEVLAEYLALAVASVRPVRDDKLATIAAAEREAVERRREIPGAIAETREEYRGRRSLAEACQLWNTLESARRRAADGGRYARLLAEALRAHPALLLDADALAYRWLESLPPGPVAQPDLWRLYREAGRPGARGKHRLFELAAVRFGPHRMSRAATGSPRKTYMVPEAARSAA